MMGGQPLKWKRPIKAYIEVEGDNLYPPPILLELSVEGK
jgi:hypothetical protein